MERDIVLNSFLADKDVRYVGSLLEVVQYLLLRYGRKITIPFFQKGIEKINKDLYDLIVLLGMLDLLKVKNLSRFIRDFKARFSDEQLDFHLKSNDEKVIQPLEKYLKKTFGENINLICDEVVSDDLILDMKGHGYAFKRSLNGDIDKLLA